MYKVVLHNNAVKSYENANSALKGKLNEAIEHISKNPYYLYFCTFLLTGFLCGFLKWIPVFTGMTRNGILRPS
ncbi:hypothetical protein, partial [Candidatus Magnetobacterium casense]|uniref:hypothetical protein n=1 Tax=Candidatus Magnetobacterium casense TaxID=1455061 RepID=UPI001C43D808